MKNIEEVIEFLQGFNDGYTFQQCETCFKFNEKDGCCNKEKCAELEAIELLISDYKRVLKENEEWQKAYQEEKDKQFELLRENQNLKEAVEIYKGQVETKIDAYIDSNYLPKQKVKDKIEEICKEIDKAIDNSKGGLDEEFINKGIELLAQKKVLQELL